QVTKTIEDGVSGIECVRHIASAISDGISLTTVTFRLETNTERALNDVKDAVTRVRAKLPRNIDERARRRGWLADRHLCGDCPREDSGTLSWFVDDTVIRNLQGIRGVARVERIGGVEREILVSLDPDRLQAAGLTVVDVSRRLRGTNVDLAGG